MAFPDAVLGPATGQKLLGASQPLAQARAMIAKLARTQAPVYISGESGSGKELAARPAPPNGARRRAPVSTAGESGGGKELAARLIHDTGARREAAFVPVNCGAIPENLM